MIKQLRLIIFVMIPVLGMYWLLDGYLEGVVSSVRSEIGLKEEREDDIIAAEQRQERRVLFITIILGEDFNGFYAANPSRSGKAISIRGLVFVEHINITFLDPLDPLDVLPLNSIQSDGSKNIDMMKMVQLSSIFAAKHKAQYLLYLNHDLILPPDFLNISISILEYSEETNMAIGMKLDCLFEKPLNEISTFEREAKSCEWHSVRISSYLLMRFEANNFSIWSRNISSIVDFSPSLMPIQPWPSNQWPRSYSNDQSWSMTQMETVIFNLTKQMIVVEAKMRACPQLDDDGSYIIQRIERKTSALYWYWNAAKQPWISPHTQGIMEHARRLGCFGLEKALLSNPLSESFKLDLKQAGQAILLKATSFIEVDPDLESIVKKIYPFGRISLNCKALNEECFIHTDGLLIEARPIFTQKYRPLITSVLRQMISSNRIQLHSFALCFTGRDTRRINMKTLTQSGRQEREPGRVPVFENGYCSRPRIFPPDEGYGEVDIALSFVDFDHVFAAAEIRGKGRFPSKQCGIKFEERNATALFRGTPTCCDARPGCDKCITFEKLERYSLSEASRYALVLWAQTHPGLVDAKFSRSRPSFPFSGTADENYIFEFTSMVSDRYYCEYQIVLVLRGFGVPFRLVQHFKSGQCVFLQHADCFQWYYPFLMPWIHYVPFRADLSDLEKNLLIVKNTPGLAKAIAHNGQVFYDKYLSWKPIHEMATKIVLEMMYNVTGLDECKKRVAFGWRVATHEPDYNKVESCEVWHKQNITHFGKCL